MSYNNTQNVLSSFKKNTVMTYAFAAPMLTVIAVLMAVFTSWGNTDLVKAIFFTAAGPALSMVYRQRKLSYWTFRRRWSLLIFGALLYVVSITFIGFGLFSGPQVGLAVALTIATYLSLSNLVIFVLVYRMKVPMAEHFVGAVERERKRSIFLMYGFLGIPIFIVFAVFVGASP